MSYWTAPHGLHITNATPDDAIRLAEIHAQGFFRGWSESEFERFLDDRAILTHVACDAKRRIRGFMMVRVAADEAEVLTVAVEKSMRRKGLGKALLAAMFEALRMTPATKLHLEVEEHNKDAIRLYQGRGFSKVASRPGYYPGPDGSRVGALVMQVDLG